MRNVTVTGVQTCALPISLRAHFPAVPLIIDAGIGVPSHAARALELGFDAVLINTAIAQAGDPAQMAAAFAQAVGAGRAEIGRASCWVRVVSSVVALSFIK